MSNRYQDKPSSATDGKSFEQLGKRLIEQFLREPVALFEDEYSQVTIGDSDQYEFKELQNSRQRLHVELRERRDLKSRWRDSGILASNTAPKFVLGNSTDIFIFYRSGLLAFRQAYKPKEVYGPTISENELPNSTIYSFVISKSAASYHAIHRFQLSDGRWRWTAVNQTHAAPPNVPQATWNTFVWLRIFNPERLAQWLVAHPEIPHP